MLVYRRDGLGGGRFYPMNSDIKITCTYMCSGHRYIIIQYLDLPFCYRIVKRDGVELIDDQAYKHLSPYLNDIDRGVYDNEKTAETITEIII
ncbi:hypothetical protein [Halobacillus yeomjeoni]|uniref:Uncharacterized protein n=1 Tax=Halobacillus yeomjeoni TaxID=311194 RepID=A0A931MUR5_9BACI|nr:hypothetical protein [Halobacillus yeomjeoni]MBH0229815.1 hypothetical protein [Halobacillus yeomjeoni]